MNEYIRFENKVIKHDGGCWEWIGAKKPSGYGNFYLWGSLRLAHRASFMLHVGEIPDDMLVLHKCDNPSCVNPHHLFLGSPKDNMDDMRRKGRAKGAPAGSEFAPCAKLNNSKVKEILARINDGENKTVIAEKYGVCYTTIYLIGKRKIWKNVNA